MHERFVYILGKNKWLSIAEIVEVANMFSLPHDFDTGNDFIITHASIPFKRLGGALKKGIVVSSGENIDEIAGDIIEHIDINRNTVRLGFSFYDTQQTLESFKRELKKEGIKYKIVNARNEQISHTDIIRRNVSEFMILKHEDVFYLAKTTNVHNPFEFRKRDIMRPFQRAIFSIPPRLCRIMINLTGIKKGVLLDPFCGIGGILQEAIIMGYEIRGSDISEDCRKMTIANLRWLCEEYNIKCKNVERNINTCDARTLSKCYKKGEIDVIVSEPFLGKPLKKKPDAGHAKKIISHLRPLFDKFINEAGKIGVRSLVFTSPLFITQNDEISIDIETIASKYGFRQYNPLREIRLKRKLTEQSSRHRFARLISILRAT